MLDGKEMIDGVPGIPAIVDAPSLNVRSGPGIDFQILGTLNEGVAVGHFDFGDDEWTQVYFVGYVASAYLRNPVPE